jgi:hypothetical protein
LRPKKTEEKGKEKKEINFKKADIWQDDICPRLFKNLVSYPLMRFVKR